MSAIQDNPRPDQSAPQKPGPQTARIGEMLRVDHAGEYGAVAIYRGQRAVFAALPDKAATAEKIADMEAGEQHHLSAFDALLAERNIRPSVLAPLWNAAGFGLGAATALMGERAAMACTAAVEEVIEGHYADQAEALESGEPALAATLRQFRAEELEHKTTAEEAGAGGHPLLRAAIKAGCRAAIKVAEKL